MTRNVAPGLALRPLAESDADELFAVTHRNRQHLRRWLPWVDRVAGPADSLAFIRRSADQLAEGTAITAGMWFEERLAGCLGTHAIDNENRSTALGYWIDAAREGRGIVTRCCAALLDHLFAEAGLYRVEIRCAIGNQRSCAIPERLGFTREGVLRAAQWVDGRFVDLVVWGLLRPDWRGAPVPPRSR